MLHQVLAHRDCGQQETFLPRPFQHQTGRCPQFQGTGNKPGLVLNVRRRVPETHQVPNQVHLLPVIRRRLPRLPTGCQPAARARGECVCLRIKEQAARHGKRPKDTRHSDGVGSSRLGNRHTAAGRILLQAPRSPARMFKLAKRKTHLRLVTTRKSLSTWAAHRLSGMSDALHAPLTVSSSELPSPTWAPPLPSAPSLSSGQ